MSLPPGPLLPSPVQTLQWIARPIPFMETNMRRYGDTFNARLAIGNVVFIANPEIIKQVFTANPDVVHGGNTPLEPFVGEHSVLLLDGKEHLRQRKLLLPPFHGERMQGYGELIAEITERDIDRWPVGRPFALRTRTQAITLEVIMRAVFGFEEGARLDRLRDLLGEMIEYGLDRWRWAAVMIPQLRRDFGPWKPWTRFRCTMDDIDAVLLDEIGRRRSNPSTAEREDILSLLVQARDEDGNAMTDRELRDELMTLLLAGHETTATALAWTFDLLLRAPQSLTRLQDEIAGGGDEYLDAVIKESLRLRPVLPGVLRRLTEPFPLNGYEIPPGSRLAPCIYLVHRRADLYPEPSRFRPERFLDGGTDTYTWLPFGGGIRRCIGASFALFEMKVAIPAILRRVRMRAVGEEPEQVRRRAITFAPARGAQVVVEQLERKPPVGGRAAHTAA